MHVIHVFRPRELIMTLFRLIFLVFRKKYKIDNHKNQTQPFLIIQSICLHVHDVHDFFFFKKKRINLSASINIQYETITNCVFTIRVNRKKVSHNGTAESKLHEKKNVVCMYISFMYLSTELITRCYI